jgi:nicotinic acid phosphoribosyltransferase
MHNSDNDDEENNIKILRPSKIVLAYLLGTSKVAKSDDGFYHVTPDLVSVEKMNIPNKYKVTLVDITYCLETRVKQAIETKRSHYEPLRRALLAQGHTLPEVVVILSRLCSRVDPCINTRHSTQRYRIESSSNRNDPPQNAPRRL